jgi:hypothetical protein
MSRNVPANADFLCDKAAALRGAIKWVLKKQDMSNLTHDRNKRKALVQTNQNSDPIKGGEFLGQISDC